MARLGKRHLKDLKMMQECVKCKKRKSLNEFQKRNDRGSGQTHHTTCKPCKVKQIKDSKKTKDGLTRQMYGAQISNSRAKLRPDPAYNLAAFRRWCGKQLVFYMLYKNWVDSGYNKKLIPSADRIDSSSEYTFDNLQLLTWGENHLKNKF